MVNLRWEFHFHVAKEFDVNCDCELSEVDLCVIVKAYIKLSHFVYFDSVVKHLESANTMFSFIWWVVGFYWVTAGGETLIHDSPQIYWFDTLFQQVFL